MQLPKLVASFEVQCKWAVWVTCQVHLQDFLADVIVVQFAVAQCHVHVESQELAVLDKDLLVYVRCFL